ncbi:MAG: 2Fe-2S iron-sulfur cluster-binding protein [Planctomycetota bacterium]|nr:2Fe-2S iron-sulfur cluster-binding protein [Planctomycetota bacterium]MDG2143066.1 2Fe-2S iron-sulfur cluster-binding protein [Planctomycetota bacterium]
MPKITFSDSSLTVEVETGSALMEACEHNDTPVDFSCTMGACATCLVVLDAGADQVDPADDDEKQTVGYSTDEANARLACQVTVNGDITVRYIG